VRFAEVRDRVFRRVCWHCHSEPDYALGDGGPGNTGGFGFAPRGLNLATYRGAQSGARGHQGQRRSIFRPVDGTPLLVAVLLARQREEAGVATDLRGMPLGLPALDAEDLQLRDTLTSWSSTATSTTG
jgi:hypothetical protein